MRKTNEKLLEAWLSLTTAIWNERMVSNLSFNEILVCGLLYKQYKLKPEEQYLSVKYLVSQTNMLKSQMSKVINGLEDREIIEKVRFKKDRRFVYVRLLEKGVSEYEKEHKKIIGVVNAIIEQIGEEDVLKAIGLFDKVAITMRELNLSKGLRNRDDSK